MAGRDVRKGFLDTVFQGPREKPHSSASNPPHEDEEVGAVGAVDGAGEHAESSRSRGRKRGRKRVEANVSSPEVHPQSSTTSPSKSAAQR